MSKKNNKKIHPPRQLLHNDFDIDRIKRFFNFVWKSPSGCWLWTGTRCHKDYGRARYYDGSNLAAHRMSYAMFRGDIMSENHIDHLCGNHRCVNPTHLRIRDPIDNSADHGPPGSYQHNKNEKVPF